LNNVLQTDGFEVTVDLLTRFGLSKDEAGMFVLLSRINKDQTSWLKGSDISRISKKGRVRTYQILQKLLEIGVVRVDYSRPKKYSVVSPQVAIRRLVSIEENKFNDLSRLESEAVQSLLRLKSLNTGLLSEEQASKSGSAVSLLHGVANIQVALREIMEDADLLISISDESSQHVLSTLNFLSKKPKTAKVIFSTNSRSYLKGRFLPRIEADAVELWVRVGTAPSFIVTDRVSVLLFYSKMTTRKKLLSPVTTFTGVSELVVIDSETYSLQVANLFELLRNDSNRVDRIERKTV
jgi:sugar-specific transcriptional regulator TrmB